jgi:hypothetical protein
MRDFVPILLLSCLACRPFSAEKISGPNIQFGPGANASELSFLSWDTESGERSQTNLLRDKSTVHFELQDKKTQAWQETARISSQIDQAQRKDLMVLSAKIPADGKYRLFFPFDPRLTPVTVLPTDWNSDGSVRFPVILSAPDYGQVLVTDPLQCVGFAKLFGDRWNGKVDFSLELRANTRCELHFSTLQLAAPAGMKDLALWSKVRRGWFNALQPSSEWGNPADPEASFAPAGILANNVNSDVVSFALWFYADQALLMADPAPGIHPLNWVRRSIDFYLDERTSSTHEIMGYSTYRTFLDANPSVLVSAWDYVEGTKDFKWLEKRISELEGLAEFLASRDVNGDGLIEAYQSGNDGTLINPNRSCSWWDALNCGYQDGYVNALIYRGFSDLADLEEKLGRKSEASHYELLAKRLKAAYAPSLMNEEKTWLGWWRSADGKLHDFASPTINGIAIEYGLVDLPTAKNILKNIEEKISEVGFNRFDVGLPSQLVPVHRSEYLLPDGMGVPSREDGTDTFGKYMNGGIASGFSLHYLTALFATGDDARGDLILNQMVDRESRGLFKSGGADWTDWKGVPNGYEGFLADNYRFLQAVLWREPALREIYSRPFRSNY